MNEAYIDVLRKLYKQVIYSEDKEFEIIRQDHLLEKLEKHFAELGINLIVVKDDMAYLSEKLYALEHYETGKIPGVQRFVSDVPLNYQQTMLCVVLLELLRKSRVKNLNEVRHLVSVREIKDELGRVLKDKANQEKKESSLENSINTVENLGYIKGVGSGKASDDSKQYELKRILTQRFSAETLEFIKEKMPKKTTNE
jgi:Domain of unknown function (DUF4194)